METSIKGAEQSGSPQPFLGSIKPSRTHQIAQHQSIASDDQNRDNALELLEALWRSTKHVHQLAARGRENGRFWNIPVKTVNEAVDRANALSNTGADAYFACAEYVKPNSRAADNASGAYGFWMDIDCSEEKHAAGKGYKTTDDALAALKQFCRDSELPEATHIIDSGSGLHLYWGMDQFVERDLWIAYAAKLKSLTKDLDFLADDSRTADIASVLRVPGTFNYKYVPPKPVTLRFASTFVEQQSLLDAIDTAYEKCCGTTGEKVPNPPFVAQAATSDGEVTQLFKGPVDIERLVSALSVLDPDCEEREWSIGCIAPLANTARAYPNQSATLKELARSWSSGELRGWPSRKWTTPGNNGYTGKEVFDRVWSRFLNSNYKGRPATLGTIFYKAERLARTVGDAKGDE